MRVKLTVDYTVCRDGIHPESFKAEDVVDMPVSIASVLIGDGRAVLPPQAAPQPAGKMEPGAPLNKMKQGAPVNKTKKRR